MISLVRYKSISTWCYNELFVRKNNIYIINTQVLSTSVGQHVRCISLHECVVASSSQCVVIFQYSTCTTSDFIWKLMNGFKGKEDTRFSCTTIKVTLNQTYAYMYIKYIKDAPPKSQYGAYSKYSRVFLIILTTDGGLHQTVKLFKIEFRKYSTVYCWTLSYIRFYNFLLEPHCYEVS